MPTTSNFGWTTPADTDLVKDGAAAIRTLGNGIDTSLVDLKGGTTGQILSKASNADLDYTWINNDQGDITEVAAGTGISGGGTSGAVTITNSMATAIDAKGDLIVGTADNAFARLASSGVNNQILTVDTSTATGLKWAAPAGGGKVLQVVSASTSSSVTVTNQTFTDSNLSVSITPSSASSKVLVIVTQQIRASRSASSAGGALRLLRDSTAIFQPAPNNFETLYMDLAGTTSVRIDLASPLTYLDSPSTTSAITYKTQGRDYNTGHTFIMQPGGSTSYIIAMEIGA